MTSAGSNGTAAPSPPLLPQNCVDLDIRQTEALGDLAGEHRFTAAVADYCDACMIPAFATTPSGTSPAAASHTSVRCGTISAQSVAQRATFQNKTELRRQSAGGGVFRLDRGLDAVRVQLRKTIMQYDACRLGHQTLAPERRSQYPTQLHSPVPRLTLMIIDHSREATGAQQDPQAAASVHPQRETGGCARRFLQIARGRKVPEAHRLRVALGRVKPFGVRFLQPAERQSLGFKNGQGHGVGVPSVAEHRSAQSAVAEYRSHASL